MLGSNNNAVIMKVNVCEKRTFRKLVTEKFRTANEKLTDDVMKWEYIQTLWPKI